MRHETPLNAGWIFAPGWTPQNAGTPIDGEAVELPHNAVDLPLSYFDETDFQKPFTYQRVIAWDDAWEGREVSLLLEASMADTRVFVNGTQVVHHLDGYTPIEARLTEHLTRGDNLITVHIDGSENPDIPPFGGRIDYLTYAGIYREAHLRVTAPVRIANVKVETPDVLAAQKRAIATVHVEAPAGGPLAGTLTARLRDAEGNDIASASAQVAGDTTKIALDGLTGVKLWTLDDPALYSLDVTLDDADRFETRFGFRDVAFTVDGFSLNGEPMKLMGLNRHQSFPYSGYAQGARSQARDAEILKWDLGCNIARTSHYPQSRHFLDRCDEIGLLVFEEIPGWQHIGDEGWKAESVRNVRRMIERDWNRPSIVIWGVRINESADDHDFYAETNALARELDPTRPTGGVRYITESELLEDVYTMNDFVMGAHDQPMSNQPRRPLRPQREITGLDRKVPYMVTEYNGHMFPTKAGDPEQRHAEHTLRHLEVLDAMYAAPDIAGCIGWCFFDYNTHKDFGAGDRICHHGVATIFREPKPAAHAYASQRDPADGITLEPVTVWARGERAIGGVLPLIVLTNCDEVELRNGALVKRIGPDRERFAHLPHPPAIFDHRNLTREELGHWGMQWEDGEIVGYIDGKVVATKRFVADPVATTLEVQPDTTMLAADDRDEVRIIVRALDQAGNPMRFLGDCVRFEIEGPARIIGPDWAVFQGGSTGLWLRATGATGPVTLTVRSGRFDPVSVSLTAG